MSVRFGVNHTPRAGWFHAWLDLDLDQIARDFENIASLGLDHIRIFPLWPLLQPNRTLIRPRALDDVRAVVDLAAQFELDVCVDALQGHLSSFDFVPSWLATWHRRNMFTDPEVVTSTATLVRALAERLVGAPNLIGVTVGNEINQFSDAVHPDPDRLEPEQARLWTEMMLASAQAALPGAMHTVANYDAAWFTDDHAFTPQQSAELGEATVVHSWVFDGTGQHYGGDSFETMHHGAYYLQLARAFGRPGRPVWLQEVGAPLNVLGEQDVERFIHETVRTSMQVPDLWGITWWCSHDVDRSLADFPELEYTLGLFSSEGVLKPAGAALRDAVAEARTSEARSSGEPVEADGERPDEVVACIGADPRPVRAQFAPGGAVFTEWMEKARGGVQPRIRISTDEPAQVGDPDYRSGLGGAATTMGQ